MRHPSRLLFSVSVSERLRGPATNRPSPLIGGAQRTHRSRATAASHAVGATAAVLQATSRASVSPHAANSIRPISKDPAAAWCESAPARDDRERSVSSLSSAGEAERQRRSRDAPGSLASASGGFARWIPDLPLDEARAERQLMRLQAPRCQDVQHGAPPGDQCVGDERAMTTPRENLGTHESERPVPLAPCEEFVECRGELRGLHMIGKTAEAGIAPGSIGGVGPRRATPTERRAVPVGDAMCSQCTRQANSVELGVTPRVRETTHIGHQPHAKRLEQLEELEEGSVGIADREDRAAPHPRHQRSTGARARERRAVTLKPFDQVTAEESGRPARSRSVAALPPWLDFRIQRSGQQRCCSHVRGAPGYVPRHGPDTGEWTARCCSRGVGCPPRWTKGECARAVRDEPHWSTWTRCKPATRTRVHARARHSPFGGNLEFPSCLLGRSEDREIRATATEVSCQVLGDLGSRGARVLSQERDSGQDHAGRAGTLGDGQQLDWRSRKGRSRVGAHQARSGDRPGWTVRTTEKPLPIDCTAREHAPAAWPLPPREWGRGRRGVIPPLIQMPPPLYAIALLLIRRIMFWG